MSNDRRPLIIDFCRDNPPFVNDRCSITQMTGIRSQRMRNIGLFRERNMYFRPKWILRVQPSTENWNSSHERQEYWSTGVLDIFSIIPIQPSQPRAPMAKTATPILHPSKISLFILSSTTDTIQPSAAYSPITGIRPTGIAEPKFLQTQQSARVYRIIFR